TVAEMQALGRRALAVACDQRDAGEVAAAVAEVERHLGDVDVLVNNAAIFRRTPFPDLTEDDWDDHLATNLKGPFLFARAVAAGMRSRGRGKIVNLADVAAFRPWPDYLPYSVAKAGLIALTQGLARALAPEVQVNAVAPGAVLWPPDYPEEAKRQFLARVPLGHAGDPADVARVVRFLIEGSDYVTGAVIPVDGGRLLV
ncbi:MAG: SDR family oxidoreductase, partial [Armatimonadetes bacterium]|nr:SDR family oxidoreductase [Armatimonadota bacterium]